MTKEKTAPTIDREIDPIVDPDVIIEEHAAASRYSVVADKLQGPLVFYRSTTKISGSGMKPKFLVIHYTAGSSFLGDLGVLSGSSGGTSCQLVIGPRGEVGAIGRLTDIMWQAGKSRWKGYTDLNNDSIGIEVTCPGWLVDKGNGLAATWSGAIIKDSDPWPFVRERHKNPKENHKVWAGFTAVQISKVIEVGEALMAHYGLIEAVGHDDIAPERKVDPGPCCPASIFHRLNGNKGGDTDIERPDLPEEGEKMQVKGVAPDTLTFRAAPNGEKRGELHEGQIVVRVGESGNWSQVRTPAGYIGWVWSDYLVPV